MAQDIGGRMTALRKASRKTGCEGCEHWAFALKAAQDRDVSNLAHSVDYCRNCAVKRGRRVVKLEGMIVRQANRGCVVRGSTSELSLEADRITEAARIRGAR